MRYENAPIVTEGRDIMMHGRFSRMEQPADCVVVDILRFEGCRLAEHWDSIQAEATAAESKSGKPTLGKAFPV
jgi:predicted SnoaL-like aldol condensation-catalyzing enzyme